MTQRSGEAEPQDTKAKLARAAGDALELSHQARVAGSKMASALQHYVTMFQLVGQGQDLPANQLVLASAEATLATKQLGRLLERFNSWTIGANAILETLPDQKKN